MVDPRCDRGSPAQIARSAARSPPSRHRSTPSARARRRRPGGRRRSNARDRRGTAVPAARRAARASARRARRARPGRPRRTTQQRAPCRPAASPGASRGSRPRPRTPPGRRRDRARTGGRPGQCDGHPVAEDARRGLGGGVEHDDVGVAELSDGRDPDAGLDLAAKVAEQIGHRRRDRCGATLGDGPPVRVRRGAQSQTDRRGHRSPNGRKACAATPPNRARPSSVEKRRASTARWQRGISAEAGQLDGVLRHVQQGPGEVSGHVAEARRQRTEHALPRPAVLAQRRGGVRDGPPGRSSATTIERVRVLHLRPPPASARTP